MSYYTNPGTPLLGGGGAIMYNSISAPDTIGPSYPDPTYYTTLGPVYLPRIYGSNLSTLEVGSSGTISYTLYDVHSLDMTRNSITNTVAMNTPTATDSFQINVANCNMSMTMDAKSNNVNIYGSNSVNLSSSNQINLVATNLNINTKNNLIFGASGGSFNANANSCNLVFNLDSNTNSASLSATCNINLLASNNLYERANSNVTISAGQAVSITAVASNLVLNGAGNTGSFTMNALDRSAYWYSASNITVGASNNMYETVGQSFAVSATGGANTLLFDNYTLNATMSTRSNMALNASNAMTVNAANSFYKLTAFAGSNLQQMDGVGITQSTQGSFYVNSSNDFVGSVSSNITLVASNTNFSATAGKKVLITAQADLYRLSAYLGSNVQQLDQVGTTQSTLGSFFINSSNDFISSVTSNIKLVASNNNFVATAGKQVLVTAQNDLYRLSAYLGSNVQQLDQVGTSQSTQGSFFVNSSNDYVASVSSNIKLVASNTNFVATAGKQVLVTAQNDLYRLSAFYASNVEQMDGVGITQSTQGSFFVNSSNDFVASVSSNIKLVASNTNFVATAGKQVLVTAQNDLYRLSAFYASNVEQMDGVGITQSTKGSFFVNSSNDWVGSVSSNITFVASNTNFSASAGKKVLINAQTDMYRLSAYIGSNVQQLDNVGTTQNTLGSFFVNSSNDFVTSVTSNIKLVASNTDFTVIAGQKINLVASNNSFSVNATGGSNTFVMDNATSSATWSSKNNIFVNSSNVMSSVATYGFNSTTTGGGFLVAAQNNVWMTSSNAAVVLTANTGVNYSKMSMDNTGVLLTTTKNATFTTPTGFSLTTSTGTGAVTLARNNNADSFALDTAGNADLNVENNVNSIAGQNQNIAATAGSVNVSAAGSNMTYTMNQASTTIAQVAGTSVVSGAYTRTTWGNETAYTATSVTYNAGLNMTYAASNNTLVTANSGSTKINMNSSPHVDDISTQSTSFNMYCTNNTIFSATSNTVIINGNLQVAGVIDSINVTQSSLLVENKMIYLAYSSNTQVSDDLVGQAGIVVEGMGLKTLAIPTAASNIAAFEKSVKWNNGSAGMYINNTAAAESFWEVKGGGVRITSSCAQLDNATQSYITASNPISFGFRINTSSGELEIYKMYIPSGQSTTTTTTVAKFGRVIIH